MKKRNLIIRMSGILFIALMLTVYFLLYFLPVVKNINRLKREVKDTALKISEFGELKSNFSYPDRKEEQYFTRAEKNFKKKIPTVRGKGDLTRLLNGISGYFHDLAKTTEVNDIRIKSSSGDPASIVQGNLKYRPLYLSFTGELKNGLHFINHISWGTGYLGTAKVTLSKQDRSLLFSVIVHIYYFAGQAGTKVLHRDKKEDNGLEIDFDSEILLERVYTNLPEKFRKSELPAEFGFLPVI